VATGSTFSASVIPGDGAGGIASACLIRPGSPTHSMDVEQRFLQLRSPCPPGQTCVESFGGPTPLFVAPATAEEAPPGDYMFFVVNDRGVPSVAKFVRVWGIVQSSVKVAATASCGGLSLQVSWRTSAETSPGVQDRVEIYPPGTSCGSGSAPIVVQFPLPNQNDRRWHQAAYAGTCQVGFWRVVVKSCLSGTESVAQCVFENVLGCPSCPPPCHPPCEFE
jgi:hypothetical protein